MSLNIFSKVFILLGENLSRRTLERQPEPESVMENRQNVEAFHQEGGERGSLLPIYHFNALAMSRMLPCGGRLVDLGCGSAQYLAYLAQCRPDLEIIGFDLSKSMLRLGRQHLEKLGLQTRVELRPGDMTDFAGLLPDRVDLISSVFSLHHLPTHEAASRCLAQIVEPRTRFNCGVWIFDFTRPRRAQTARDFAAAFVPHAPLAHQEDIRDSLFAAFSFEELNSLIATVAKSDFRHARSLTLPLYQAHWLEPAAGAGRKGSGQWRATPLDASTIADFRRFKTMLKAVPLENGA